MSYSTAKVGKHGAAKAMITGIDIFTAQKYECTVSTGDNIDSPNTKRIEYTLIDINEDDFVTLMDEQGEMKEDLKLPTDEWLKDQVAKIREYHQAEKECFITVLSACGKEKIVSVREGKNWLTLNLIHKDVLLATILRPLGFLFHLHLYFF